MTSIGFVTGLGGGVVVVVVVVVVVTVVVGVVVVIVVVLVLIVPLVLPVVLRRLKGLVVVVGTVVVVIGVVKSLASGRLPGTGTSSFTYVVNRPSTTSVGPGFLQRYTLFKSNSILLAPT